MTMIGLDVTHQRAGHGRARGAICARGQRGDDGRRAARLLPRFHRTRYPDLAGSPMHDPVAVAHVIDPELVDVATPTSRSTAAGSRAGPHERRLARARALRPAERQGRARHRRRAVRRAPDRADRHARMTLVFAAIATHGGLVFDRGDPRLADACLAALREDSLPAAGVTFGATADGDSEMPIEPRPRALPGRSVRVLGAFGTLRRGDRPPRSRQRARRARRLGPRGRRHGARRQLLAVADAARRDRRYVAPGAAELRGADVLRDAHGVLLAAGLRAGSENAHAWRANGGSTRRPRRRRVA